MAANVLTVCPQMTAGGGDSRYVHVLPSGPSMRGSFIHPDHSCRYQNRVLIIYTLCTVFWIPSLGPFAAHNNKLSFQAVHQFAHQNPIYTRWKPSATEVQCSLCLEFTQWLGWWNACWASVTTSQTWNNKNTSTSGDSKWIQNKVRIYRLISFFFFFFPLHQLTVNRTHDDPCSASLGYFHTEWPETFEALQHTP